MTTSSGRVWGGRTADERQAQRRAQLLAAGLEVFGVDGWSKTTVRDICSAAALSQRYFYEEFEDREALFLAVLEHIAVEVEEVVKRSLSIPAAEPKDRARAMLGALADLFTADPRKLRVAFIESFATVRFRESRGALIDSFAERAARLMASLQPDLRNADLKTLELSAFVISGGIAEAFVATISGSRDLEIDALVDHLVSMYEAAAALAPDPLIRG